jgi:hypothetical protein
MALFVQRTHKVLPVFLTSTNLHSSQLVVIESRILKSKQLPLVAGYSLKVLGKSFIWLISCKRMGDGHPHIKKMVITSHRLYGI